MRSAGVFSSIAQRVIRATTTVALAFVAVTSVILTASRAAEPEPKATVYKVGFLWGLPPIKEWTGAFDQELAELGRITMRTSLGDFALKEGLPAMFTHRQFVELGGLASYGANFPDLFRRAAGYVDKILKGANPGDLPVQQPIKFQLFLNLETAKALGLTIPPSVLQLADQVIE